MPVSTNPALSAWRAGCPGDDNGAISAARRPHWSGDHHGGGHAAIPVLNLFVSPASHIHFEMLAVGSRGDQGFTEPCEGWASLDGPPTGGFEGPLLSHTYLEAIPVLRSGCQTCNFPLTTHRLSAYSGREPSSMRASHVHLGRGDTGACHEDRRIERTSHHRGEGQSK
jgi:hypothetical protein